MSTSYWLDRSSKNTSKTYDFVIVGGGIAGLSTAYWLQKQNPAAKIALLERHRIGYGASGRNAGFVTCGSTEHFMKLHEKYGAEKAGRIWKFSEQNRELLKEHVIGGDFESVDFRQTGSCTVAPSEMHWQKYRGIAKVMNAQGIEMQEVSPSDMEKDYGITGFVGGMRYAGDGFIHPIKLLEKIRGLLKVDIFEGTEVYDIQSARNHVIKTDHGSFETPKVLLTLNAYVSMVLKEFSSWVLPQRSQILVTEPLPAFVKGPCYLTKYLCYFRQLPTGHLLVGGFRNLAEKEENTALDQATEVIQTALYDFVRSHFRHGPEAKIAYQWSGIMGFTPDGHMMIGEAPHRPGLHLMAGCGGHGMGLSFHAAKVFVESLAGKAVPEYLDIRRFSELFAVSK